ncbi:ISAs1 family transposase [Telmatocola sphagniphila]|uniref:ISAs1 family transposase n=1 Tax=Telmatocola sphagniphila TaxID=1123043 RepID=A0A8E6B4B5_9BACT|nr:ISAs1 family transposase [Telmatocola sphagniphila]QVL31708.1 ISAs1 family transposase [Telmatocola sphagniphila]
MGRRGITIGEVLCHFEELEDLRSEINRKHPLESVIVIALLGVLSRASGPTGIATWANLNADFLQSLLHLPHGIPGKDVFRRVLCALKPEAFQQCFSNWIKTLRTAAAQATENDRPTLAVDGKTLRRSHDVQNGLGPLHSVSVWASEYGITLAQVATDEKSNEITAIPRILQLVDFKGAIVAIDALGTQKAIAERVVDGGGDFVLALKRNQEKLLDGVEDYLVEQMEKDFADVKARRRVAQETGHGRTETREYIQLEAPSTLPGLKHWKKLKTIGLVHLTSLRNGQETTRVRYFISSLPMGIKQFAQATRNHWGIENSCHWSLDVTYREDDSRIRHVDARENFAWLNRFTLSLLKQHPGKGSLVMKRRSCGWNSKFLLEVLTAVRS